MYFMVGTSVCKDYNEAEMFTLIEEESANCKLYYLIQNNMNLSYKNLNENNLN